MTVVIVTSDNADDQMLQSIQPFDALPPKVQRVWMEEFKEPEEDRVFIVCAWWGRDAGVFSLGDGLCFQTQESRFPTMGDLCTCSRLAYVLAEDTIKFVENTILTDNHDESWVEEVRNALMELAKQPGLEDSVSGEDNEPPSAT